MNHALDSYDLQLLSFLQENGRLTNVELSEKVHLSPSQISRRLQRLIDDGFIKSFHAHLDARLIGFGMMAYCLVTLKIHGEGGMNDFHQRVRTLPEILECQSLTGEADYLLKIAVSDLKAFSDFISNHLMKAPEVAHVRTSIVLESIKESTSFPLHHLKFEK